MLKGLLRFHVTRSVQTVSVLYYNVSQWPVFKGWLHVRYIDEIYMHCCVIQSRFTYTRNKDTLSRVAVVSCCTRCQNMDYFQNKLFPMDIKIYLKNTMGKAPKRTAYQDQCNNWYLALANIPILYKINDISVNTPVAGPNAQRHPFASSSPYQTLI